MRHIIGRYISNKCKNIIVSSCNFPPVKIALSVLSGCKNLNVPSTATRNTQTHDWILTSNIFISVPPITSFLKLLFLDNLCKRLMHFGNKNVLLAIAESDCIGFVKCSEHKLKNGFLEISRYNEECLLYLSQLFLIHFLVNVLSMYTVNISNILLSAILGLIKTRIST